MELTRRDALAALATGGAGAYSLGRLRSAVRTGTVDEFVTEQLRAVAEVVYPSAVDATTEFVETYVVGRSESDEEYIAAIESAGRALDDYARREFGSRFVALSPERREQVLRSRGVDKVHPRPDGTVPERIRYYLVNELLYALVTSPTGGELIGNENPPGYPGGTETYQVAEEK